MKEDLVAGVCNLFFTRVSYCNKHNTREAIELGKLAMEPQMRKLGGSLKVPFVQELIKEKPSSVPARYVRPDRNQYPTISICDGNSSHELIPVVDLQRLIHPEDEDATNPELQKLHSACKDWGFFQLTNHGVSTSLLETVKLGVEDFFSLPMEEKSKFGQKPGDVEGYGQAFVTSEEQKLDWADMFYMVTLPKSLRKPQFFPKLPDPIREALDEYSVELKAIGYEILTQIAKALGMKFEDISLLFEEGMQSMRLNYYPPCPQPELAIGLCNHSDPVGITILLQISEVEGLQIKKDGAWLPVVPLPNAFIVNVGDILEIVTNGIYKSVEHRATVSLEKERLSIATFLFPKLESEFGPAPSLISPETPANFRGSFMVDYLKGLYSRELEGKSYRDAMKI